jgi:hypothetical protein
MVSLFSGEMGELTGRDSFIQKLLLLSFAVLTAIILFVKIFFALNYYIFLSSCHVINRVIWIFLKSHTQLHPTGAA